MLRICYGFATVSPEVIGWRHGSTTVLMECCGCATVLRRSLRLWHGLISHTYIKSSAEQPLSTLSRCRRRGRLRNSPRKNKICCWLQLNSIQLQIHINQTKDKKKKKKRSVWAKDWLQRQSAVRSVWKADSRTQRGICQGLQELYEDIFRTLQRTARACGS